MISSLEQLMSGDTARRRIFISYHHARDQEYYRAFSNTFHDTYEVLYDTSLERAFDSRRLPGFE